MQYFDKNKQKFQQGGQQVSPEQQEKIKRLMLAYMQLKGYDPNNKNQVRQAAGEFSKLMQRVEQQDQQAIEEFSQVEQIAQQQMATSAAKGAKLNYIRSLKGKCPEGQEPIYLKNGGQCGCGPKKELKLENGDKVENKKDFFKKDKCGGKMKKHQDGGQIIKADDGVSLLSRLQQLFKRKLPTAEPASERYAGGQILDDTPNFIYIQGPRSLNDVNYPPTISRQIVDSDTIYTEKAPSSSPYVSGVRTTNNDSNRAGYERAQRRFNQAYSTLGGNPYK